MEELDKRSMIENSISKEELSTEEKFIKKENKLSDVIFHEEHEKEIKAFHKFISKGLNNTLYKDGSPNRGADRAKSHNPMMDAYEKKHVEELPVNKIFKLEEYDESLVYGMKSIGIVGRKPEQCIDKLPLMVWKKEQKKESGFMKWWKAWMKQIKNGRR